MRRTDQLSPELLFPAAFDQWIGQNVIRKFGLTTNARYIGPTTETDYRQYASALEKMFCSLKLGEIHDGHIREYHRARAFCDGAWSQPAGANLIRKEVQLLIRLLRCAGVWSDLEEAGFQPLQRVETDVQRAMNVEEERHLLTVLSSRDEWKYLLNYTIVALQTTMSTNELRSLRIGDVSLRQGIVQVRVKGAKNRFRIRTIPIETKECIWAFEGLIDRANDLGSAAGHHFLFPFREVRNSYDPTRPMGNSALKKPWNEVRVASNLTWLRLYDLRHTAITRMAETGIPIPIILSFAGHVSQKMQQHYTQISMMAQRKAAASTWANTPAVKMVPNRRTQGGFPPQTVQGDVYGRRASDRRQAVTGT